VREYVDDIARHWGLTLGHLSTLASFAACGTIDGYLLSKGPPGSLWLIGWVLEILFVGGTLVMSGQFLIILGMWAYENVVSEGLRVAARIRKVRDRESDDAE
jgi:hypothetical protein